MHWECLTKTSQNISLVRPESVGWDQNAITRGATSSIGFKKLLVIYIQKEKGFMTCLLVLVQTDDD